MSGTCPTCQRLVFIRPVRVESSGRWIYRTLGHDNGDKYCEGGFIR